MAPIETPEESTEDVLRRQLIEKTESATEYAIVTAQLQTQIQSLQAQLAQRPPLNAVQELQKEYTNLDILLQGTQRENERCMTELERGKVREKMLERELEKLAGVNWQANLNIVPSTTPSVMPSRAPTDSRAVNATAQTTLAHIEQVRMLILGMEQRLQSREDKLMKTIERAETEGARFEHRIAGVMESGRETGDSGRAESSQSGVNFEIQFYSLATITKSRGLPEGKGWR
ncbi:uncharacterized protein B0H18DRAFT_1006244 [Fomitopsis serialis]|uniref:uncharacterized protein n=1 Tax=Fomitopsis serialis TaxID=139415 RepID=UPI00200852E3|nr:uncharacterized protein B0H18DRAFT_1006244 [Neoantrodia serialis]KAH9926468.1 hypothetical protein B0H18DRAFT_1006244 [Neoantrodia serialis]